MENRWIKRRNFLFPYLMLLTAGSALALTILMRRFELTIFSLVIVIPLVLAGIILLFTKKMPISDLPTYSGKLRFSHLFYLNILIFIISLIVLVSSTTRPLVYFILVSLYAGVLLLQILCRRENWTDNSIILQLIFLSLNLIWGLTLKYTLYFGDTDLLVHFGLIDTILKTGHVSTLNADYEYYAVYHILTAIGVEVTGASLRTVLFIIMGLTWQVCILFAFLIFRKLSESSKVALIACLLFALSSQVIFYGSYSIARSLAFVFLMAWFYLIVDKAQKDARYLFLSIIIISALIATHHLNVLYVIPVLAVVYFCQVLVNRSRPDSLVQLPFLYLFSIGTISYFVWVSSSVENANVLGTLQNLFKMETSIKESADLTHGYGLSLLMGTVYYSFILFLCLVGLKTVLNHTQLPDSRQKAAMFALAGFVTLALYIPGFLYLLPLSDVILTDRISLLVSPFVAFLSAYGIKYLYDTEGAFMLRFFGKVGLSLVIPVLIMVTTFASVISIGNAKDTNYLVHTSMVDSPYFTDSELRSFSFLNEKVTNNEVRLYADYPTSRNVFLLGRFVNRNIIESGNFSYIENGILIIRTAELQRKKSLSFSPDGEGRVIYRYPKENLDYDLVVLSTDLMGSKIYSNTDIQIYLISQ